MIRSSNNKCVHFLATDRMNLYTCGNYVVFKVSFRFLLVGKKGGVFVWGKCIIYSSNVQGSCVFVFVACCLVAGGGGTTTGCRSRVDGNSSACHGLMVQG